MQVSIFHSRIMVREEGIELGTMHMVVVRCVYGSLVWYCCHEACVSRLYRALCRQLLRVRRSRRPCIHCEVRSFFVNKVSFDQSEMLSLRMIVSQISRVHYVIFSAVRLGG